MGSFRLLLVLWGLLLPAAWAAARDNQATTPPAMAPVFAGDARLQAALALVERDRPLGEFLARLGRELGVPLRATAETTDDRVTLCVRDRPAGELLSLVASQFDFEWFPRGSGYELRQTAAGRRREAAQRDQEVRRQLQIVDRRIQKLARLAGTPAEQLEARGKEIDDLPRRGLDAAAAAALEDESAAITDVLYVPGQASIEIYRALTPGQRRALLAGKPVRLSSLNGTLSPALARRVDDAATEWELDETPWRQLPPAAAMVDIHLDDAVPPSCPFARDAIWSTLEFVLTSIHAVGDRSWRWSVVWSPTVPPAVASPATASDAVDSELQQPVDLRIERPRRQGAPVVMDLWGRNLWPRGLLTIGEFSQALAEATGFDVVADSFVRARIDPALVSGRRPLRQLLDTVAHELDYQWEKRSSLILLRNRFWIRDRPEEVPDRVLKPWRQRAERLPAWQGAPAVDCLAALATALSDVQARGMESHWGWYLEECGISSPHGEDSGGFYDQREHLRFWASLSPAQKQSLLAGGALPVREIDAAQRSRFAAALLSKDPGTPVPAAGIPLQELVAGRVELGTTALRRDVTIGTDAQGRRDVTVSTSTDLERAPIHSGFQRYDSEGHPVQQAWQAGPSTLMDRWTFRYYLGGTAEPWESVVLDLPRGTKRGLSEKAPAPPR